MTVENTENTQAHSQISDPFAYLYPYEFVLLTTFRKNGIGVPTAMWFAHEHGKLYMVTGKMAGKIKRIHNNSRVLLAPCTAGGRVLDKQVEGYARELPPAQHEYANALLASKYGEEYEMSDSEEGTGDGGYEETYIEVESGGLA